MLVICIQLSAAYYRPNNCGIHVLMTTVWQRWEKGALGLEQCTRPCWTFACVRVESTRFDGGLSVGTVGIGGDRGESDLEVKRRLQNEDVT